MNTIHVAQRMNHFSEYIFARLAKEAAEVEKMTGRKVLNFGPGSPDIPPSQKYLDALASIIKEPGAHLYPGYRAIPELTTALTSWYLQRFDVTIGADELLPLLGAKDGVTHLPVALFDEGDEVLIPDPGYPAYQVPTLLVGAQPILYELDAENDFRISVKNLAKKITSRTKAVWINSPSNPTGHVASVEELEPVVELCRTHNLMLLYDNAYSEITFDGVVAPSILQIAHAKELAVEIGSFSKTFSLAGYRMGWIAGNAAMVFALAKVKSQLDSGMSVPLQKLGALTLTEPDLTWKTQMLASYQKRRDTIAKKLRTLGLTFSLPKGALYIWAKIPDAAENAEVFCQELLREKQILVTPGSAFGPSGARYVRVSICINIERIDEYV